MLSEVLVQGLQSVLIRISFLKFSSGQVTHLLDDLKELWMNIKEFISCYLMKAHVGQCHTLNDLESYLS